MTTATEQNRQRNLDRMKKRKANIARRKKRNTMHVGYIMGGQLLTMEIDLEKFARADVIDLREPLSLPQGIINLDR